MNILNYIENNIVSIVIFLVTVPFAIIGYYADKKFSEQKNESDKKEKLDLNLLNKPLADALGISNNSKQPINQYNDQQPQMSEKEKEESSIGQIKESKDTEDSNKKTKPNKNQKYDFTVLENSSNDSNMTNFTNDLSSKELFDNEFDSVIPKKNVLTHDLLNDIENLSLDKTQKLELSEIPDLDDIDLPKIKKMSDDEDIWKL